MAKKYFNSKCVLTFLLYVCGVLSLCVFEKQVYSILLVLTIIIILAALTSNVINHKQKEIEYQKLDVDVPEAVVVRNQSNTQNLSLRLTRP